MEKNLFSRWLVLLTIILMAALNSSAMKPILPYGQWTKAPWTAKVYYTEDINADGPEGWLDAEFDDSSWETMEGPFSNSVDFYGNTGLKAGKYFIRRAFSLTDPTDEKYRIVVNRHSYYSDVYINDSWVNYDYYDGGKSDVNPSHLREGSNILCAELTISGESNSYYYDSGIYESSLTEKPTSDLNNVEYTITNDPTHPWRQDGDKGIFPDDINETSSVTFNFNLDHQGQVSIVGKGLDSQSLSWIIDGKKESSHWRMGGYGDDDELYIIPLEAGSHTVEFVYEKLNSYKSQIKVFDVFEYRDWIEVEATQDGIAANVLSQVASVNDVRCVKISGEMNDMCFAHLQQMPHLCAVDMSGATATSIPSQTFYSKWKLTSVKLPSGVKTIGSSAFKSIPIRSIVLPETLEKVESEAFTGTLLKSIVIPNSVTTLGSYLFGACIDLQDVTLPGQLKRIPSSGFYSCSSLTTIQLPSSLKEIGDECFYDCYSITTIQLPDSLEDIGKRAFSYSGLESIGIPVSVKRISDSAFSNTKLKEITLPPYNEYNYGYTFSGCDSLKRVYFTSLCVPEQYNMFSDVPEGLTLVVPPISLTDYRNDLYFNYFPIEPGEEIDYWGIYKNWTLDESRRPSVKPNVEMLTFTDEKGHLTVNGAAPLALGSVTMPMVGLEYRNPTPTIISNCSSLTLDSLTLKMEINSESEWYFFTPLADVKASDIRVEYKGTGYVPDNIDYVIRYYDGAYRAANGNDGSRQSWKNLSEPTLKAGQGYIFQTTSRIVDLVLPAAVNGSLTSLSENDAVVALQRHPSEYVYDKNWNFVGNPYASFFDILHMDYTAPITVWNHSYQLYEAYTVTDDDYALSPGQAFFVQSPDDVNEIRFSKEGRQHTDEINHANGVRQLNAENGYARFVVDIRLTDGTNRDRSRLVLNEEASLEYELTRDANKLMSMNNDVPQIYTIDHNNSRLAINERPVADGEALLGMYLPSTSKEYSIKTTRAQTAIYLYDKETGAEAYLSGGSEYLFTTSKAGYVDDRFILRVAPTSMETLKDAQTKVITGEGYITVVAEEGSTVTISGIDGIQYYRGEAETVQLQRGVYVVTVNGKNHKVLVR